MSIIVLGLVIVYAWRRFANNRPVFGTGEREPSPITRFVYNKYFVDEAYDVLIVKPSYAFGRFAHRIIENKGLDGIINGTGKLITGMSSGLRKAQTGNIGFYIFIMVFGIIAMLIWNIIYK
jgi:NADH-quinone oxidoreductase subunit L